MRIAVQILYTESWQKIFEIVGESLMEYCDRHKYELMWEMFPEPYPSNFGFNKFKKIKETFSGMNGVKVVMSMDADALITNHNTKIESFLSPEHDFYICRDVNSINAGVFIIRKSEWTMRFIDYVLGTDGKEGMYCEQNGIEAYMKEFPADEKIKVLPQSNFNAYLYQNYPEFGEQTEENGQWVEGKSFVLHLPGLGIDKRIEILKNIIVTK